MYIDILPLLKCNVCESRLSVLESQEIDGEIIQGKLSCVNGHEWEINDGVLDFRNDKDKEKNYWAKRYEEMHYDEVDRDAKERTPEKVREAYAKSINNTIEKVNKLKPRIILDIATGRGMLLIEMVKHISSSTQIICIDRGFAVLKYDRIKTKKINPDIKINYIACDAANLPFVDDSVEVVTSFFGYFNMLDKMPKGIEEASRVLKDNGCMLNVDFIIHETSEGYRVIEECFKQNNLNLHVKHGTLEGIKDAYKDSRFNELEIIVIDEGIGIKHDTGIIPYENEWYGVVLIDSLK